MFFVLKSTSPNYNDLSHPESPVRKSFHPLYPCPTWRRWMHRYLQGRITSTLEDLELQRQQHICFQPHSLYHRKKHSLFPTRCETKGVSEHLKKKRTEKRKQKKVRTSKQSLVPGFILGTDKPHAAPCSQLEENTQFSPYCVTKKL